MSLGVTKIPIASGIQSGQSLVQSYRRDGKEVAVRPIDEFILIRGGAIEMGTPKKLGLDTLPYQLSIDSFWFHSANPAQDNVRIDLVRGENVLVSFSLERRDQIKSCTPYLVLTHQMDIIITPDSALLGFEIFAHQVVNLETINV